MADIGEIYTHHSGDEFIRVDAQYSDGSCLVTEMEADDNGNLVIEGRSFLMSRHDIEDSVK